MRRLRAERGRDSRLTLSGGGGDQRLAIVGRRLTFERRE